MIRRTLIGVVIFLAACAPAPVVPVLRPGPTEPLARYSLLPPENVYRVQPAKSRIEMYVFRAGAAARLGHNHVLSVPHFQGAVALSGDSPKDAIFDVHVRWADVAIDDPALRREIGGNFSGERSASDIEGTRANLLGDQGVQAERYPDVHLAGRVTGGDWPLLTTEVAVTLKGVTRMEALPLRVAREDNSLRASGTLQIKQSDYGITPFFALGGLMAVQDEVVMRFEIVASK